MPYICQWFSKIFPSTKTPPLLLQRGRFSLSKKATYRWSFSRIRKGNAV